MLCDASRRCWQVGRGTRMALFCGLLTLNFTAEAFENQRLKCTDASGEDVRVLEVVYQADGSLPCRTEYTKWGNVRVIGQASQAAGFCEGLANTLAGKLIKAGFDCGGGDLMAGASAPALSAAASTSAQRAAEVSTANADPQAVNYLNALKRGAKSGQRWAANELALIQSIGVDVFYRRWQAELFTTIDVNHDGGQEWLVRTADCSANRCQRYLLRRGAEREPSGYELTLLMVADAPSLQAFNCAVPRGQMRPVYAQGGDGNARDFRVFEADGDAYRERHHCVEVAGSGDLVEIRWPLKDGRKASARENEVIRGVSGDCRRAYQAMYPSCYVP